MNEKKREAHPGWVIRFEDGTWLGGGHGWFRTKDAFYADIDDTEEEANRWLNQLPTILKGDAYPPAIVVEAWQPLCERLRHDVIMLEKANLITPDDLFEAVNSLSGVLHILNSKKKV
jgi:hypothetical protein